MRIPAPDVPDLVADGPAARCLGVRGRAPRPGADAGRVLTQTPEVAASEVRGEPAAERGASRNPRRSQAARPRPGSGGRGAPTGTSLKTTFEGGSKAARLKATCDNHVVVYLNGKRVAASDDWQSPVEADVQQHVLPGKNELVAEVRNEGGPAGFALKLALRMPDGSTRYVVSDARTGRRPTAATPRNGPPRGWSARWATPPGATSSPARGSAASARRGSSSCCPASRSSGCSPSRKDELGSWVSITFDDKGRLIASDQGKQGPLPDHPAADRRRAARRRSSGSTSRSRRRTGCSTPSAACTCRSTAGPAAACTGPATPTATTSSTRS